MKFLSQIKWQLIVLIGLISGFTVFANPKTPKLKFLTAKEIAVLPDKVKLLYLKVGQKYVLEVAKSQSKAGMPVQEVSLQEFNQFLNDLLQPQAEAGRPYDGSPTTCSNGNCKPCDQGKWCWAGLMSCSRERVRDHREVCTPVRCGKRSFQCGCVFNNVCVTAGGSDLPITQRCADKAGTVGPEDVKKFMLSDSGRQCVEKEMNNAAQFCVAGDVGNEGLRSRLGDTCANLADHVARVIDLLRNDAKGDDFSQSIEAMSGLLGIKRTGEQNEARFFDQSIGTKCSSKKSCCKSFTGLLMSGDTVANNGNIDTSLSVSYNSEVKSLIANALAKMPENRQKMFKDNFRYEGSEKLPKSVPVFTLMSQGHKIKMFPVAEKKSRSVNRQFTSRGRQLGEDESCPSGTTCETRAVEIMGWEWCTLDEENNKAECGDNPESLTSGNYPLYKDDDGSEVKDKVQYMYLGSDQQAWTGYRRLNSRFYFLASDGSGLKDNFLFGSGIHTRARVQFDSLFKDTPYENYKGDAPKLEVAIQKPTSDSTFNTKILYLGSQCSGTFNITTDIPVPVSRPAEPVKDNQEDLTGAD